MSDKKFEWKDVIVSIGGVQITGITEIKYKHNYTIEQLKQQLDDALEVENYELCAELKILIDNFNK